MLEDAKETCRRLQGLLREALTLSRGLSQTERAQDAGVGEGAGRSSRFRIERYRDTRFWALYEGETLLAVTVYKKGAQRVAERLTELIEAKTIAETAEDALPPRASAVARLHAGKPQGHVHRR